MLLSNSNSKFMICQGRTLWWVLITRIEHFLIVWAWKLYYAFELCEDSIFFYWLVNANRVSLTSTSNVHKYIWNFCRQLYNQDSSTFTSELPLLSNLSGHEVNTAPFHRIILWFAQVYPHRAGIGRAELTSVSIRSLQRKTLGAYPSSRIIRVLIGVKTDFICRTTYCTTSPLVDSRSCGDNLDVIVCERRSHKSIALAVEVAQIPIQAVARHGVLVLEDIVCKCSSCNLDAGALSAVDPGQGQCGNLALRDSPRVSEAAARGARVAVIVYIRVWLVNQNVFWTPKEQSVR